MLKHVMESHDILDDAHVDGPQVADLLKSRGVQEIDVKTITGKGGSTDFIKATIPGTVGKKSGGSAPTSGIIGRLGGHEEERGHPERRRHHCDPHLPECPDSAP
jgi:hypothetical protein